MTNTGTRSQASTRTHDQTRTRTQTNQLQSNGGYLEVGWETQPQQYRNYFTSFESVSSADCSANILFSRNTILFSITFRSFPAPQILLAFNFASNATTAVKRYKTFEVSYDCIRQYRASNFLLRTANFLIFSAYCVRFSGQCVNGKLATAYAALFSR